MKILHIMSVLTMAALLYGCVLKGAEAQPPLPDTLTLVRQSDFVGFVLADPMVSHSNGEWRQSLFLSHVDSLKGRLKPDPTLNNQYPWVSADRSPASGYPTWCSEKGEYLVFLRRGTQSGRDVWTTTAAFRVAYRPDATGKILGTLLGDRPEATGKIPGTHVEEKPQGMNVALVREFLERVVTNKSSAPEAGRRLDTLFKSAISAGRLASQHRIASHEERLREAQQLAALIKSGTPRTEMEKVFPQEDGGISSPNGTRYYLGSEVMVEVPYDQTGGPWKPQNRVNGPVKVYKDVMHFD